MVDSEIRLLYYIGISLMGVSANGRWHPMPVMNDREAGEVFVQASTKLSKQKITPQNMRKLMQMIVDDRQ